MWHETAEERDRGGDFVMKSKLEKFKIHICLFWKREPKRKEKKRESIKRPFVLTAAVLIMFLAVGVLVYITASETVLRLSIWVNLVVRSP